MSPYEHDPIFELILPFLFGATLVVWAAAGTALSYVRESEWNIALRILVCFLLLPVMWISSSGILGLYFRESLLLGQVVKNLIDGPLIAIVLIYGLPRVGKYVAAPLLCLYIVTVPPDPSPNSLTL